MDPRLAAQLRVTALADAEFVDTVYLLALRRDPDPSARERALAKLGDGTLSRAARTRSTTPSPSRAGRGRTTSARAA